MALNKRTLLLAAAIAGAGVIVLFLAQDPGNSAQQEDGTPVMSDKDLRVELVAEGLSFPTSMRFLGDDILVLQKEGQVRLVSQGELYEKPILQLDVASGAEQGLLGIAGRQDSVLLYFTASDAGELKNRIFKYDYDRDERVLANGTLVMDLPGEPGPFHNGGKIAIGPDGYLYAVIGDTNAGGGMLDNEVSGRGPDDKSVILRVDRETGAAVEGSPFYGDEKLARYYAYGIRNSFGMDFDPVSGRLWMTENGPDEYDEINVVTPGFNSGWHKITGPIARSNATLGDLVMFEGAAYRDPAFSWQLPVGVTDIEFFESGKLGEQYKNNIFVGDVNHGNLYLFQVDGDRTGLHFAQPELVDLVADTEQQGDKLKSEAESVIVGKNFGRITDIETGPDGLLYILAYEDGKIYRVAR
ncbi:MAG: PQQ-dependent sugar dehydrogenase [Nitrososphaera sp.]|uniref:PQQ-dependent sugar dehydrogenase n=1 Tax=Nitrososphaera sp. TaxID=1971748 RepID=UPI003D6E3F52